MFNRPFVMKPRTSQPMHLAFLSVASITTFLTPTPMYPQTLENPDRVLIPAYVRGLYGAEGSFWFSTLAITNKSDTPIIVEGYAPCYSGPATCPGPPPIPPHATIFVDGVVPGPFPAAFIYVEKGRLDDVAFSLRLQDVSRHLETWGTAIPVVRDGEWLRAKLELIDIPVDATSRLRLRIYNRDESIQSGVSIRLFSVDPGHSSGGPADRLLEETHTSFLTALAIGLRDLFFTGPVPVHRGGPCCASTAAPS